MRTVSQVYRDLLFSGAAMEVRATVGGVTYGMDSLAACSIAQAAMSGQIPEIGACVSNTLSLEILDPAPIPRMADILIETRLTDGVAVSEWLQMGTFYVDTREYIHGGVVRLEAYDDMLKAEQSFADLFQWDQSWPIKMSEALQLISDAMGTPLDGRNVIKDYDIGGPEDYTCRDVLGFIAAANAGNWTISPQRTLRLVPFRPEGDSVQDIGLAVKALEMGDPITIGRVNVFVTEDSAYVVGAEAGATYAISCTCPWATQQMADDILAKLDGYVYQPYSAAGVILDPAAELGDLIEVDGWDVYIGSAAWQLTGGWIVDVSSPGEKEVDHEYPYKSPSKRQYERVIRKINATADELTESYSAAIRVSQEQMESTFVKSTEYEDAQHEQDVLIDNLASALRQTASGLEAVVERVTSDSGYIDTLRLRLALTVKGLTINRSAESVYILIDNSQVVFLRDEADGTQTKFGQFSAQGLSTDEVSTKIVNAVSAEFSSHVSIGSFSWVDEGSLGFSLVLREG